MMTVPIPTEALESRQGRQSLFRPSHHRWVPPVDFCVVSTCRQPRQAGTASGPYFFFLFLWWPLAGLEALQPVTPMGVSSEIC
jgi:hypothetical protein